MLTAQQKLLSCQHMEAFLPKFFFLLLLLLVSGAFWTTKAAGAGATFTLKNNCPYTIWPGTLSGNGVALLGGGGFELSLNDTASFSAPPGWSGRFWARTRCLLGSSSSNGTCATGDCGGVLRCVVGGAPPASLAEFTLGSGDGTQDFYDVSLVDGYNVGIGVRPSRGSCRYAGCVADVNARCPAELRVPAESGETVACRSACEAFGAPEYCCTGAHGSPATCGPTRYSQLFKAACPAAYSYAYDDATSTFTCAAGTADYLITFCPSAADAQSKKR
ncbi:pathogenesis-related thaumatin-like protein 3.5 isoform X1 [Musa acuminata AAA Group]|uniref:pathogenesis-related thaumatin-like protein 3.5 isoform X1 n=2 Tax=Musa acuminata AAA Group TaxID=214697 RepID=UPI0031D1176A